MQLLEHVILAQGIIVDPTKVEVVIKWECPKSVTKIKSFVGLADYYMRFIEGFFKIVVPLTQLTRKDQLLLGLIDVRKAFESLRKG